MKGHNCVIALPALVTRLLVKMFNVYIRMRCLGVNFSVLQKSLVVSESVCPGSGLSLHQVLSCLQYSSKYEIQ